MFSKVTCALHKAHEPFIVDNTCFFDNFNNYFFNRKTRKHLNGQVRSLILEHRGGRIVFALVERSKEILVFIFRGNFPQKPIVHFNIRVFIFVYTAIVRENIRSHSALWEFQEFTVFLDRALGIELDLPPLAWLDLILLICKCRSSLGMRRCNRACLSFFVHVVECRPHLVETCNRGQQQLTLGV